MLFATEQSFRIHAQEFHYLEKNRKLFVPIRLKLHNLIQDSERSDNRIVYKLHKLYYNTHNSTTAASECV